MLDLNELLRFTVEQRGSDLHIKVGSPPHVRVDGHLLVSPFDVVSPSDAERMAYAILPKDRADEFELSSEADFAHSVSGLGRFRVNVHRQRGSVGLVLRRVLPGAPHLDALGLPPSVRAMAEEDRGLVLITGVNGSGRSTTAASLLDHVNEARVANILTI